MVKNDLRTSITRITRLIDNTGKHNFPNHMYKKKCEKLCRYNINKHHIPQQL